MDDRVWKNISIVLGVVCAILLGIAGALMVVHKGGTSSASPSPDASGISEGSPAPTDSSGASIVPGTSQDPNATATPVATLGKSSPATVTFTGLALDAANDKAGTARTFTFTSDSKGPVTYAVTKTSAGGTTKLCAKVDTGAFACKVGATPNFLTGTSDSTPNVWTVTLVGYGNSKPTVNVTFTWPTVTAKLTLNHLRFQGTGAAEALNGFSATFKPRSAGPLNVQASWTTINADVEMSLADVTTPPEVAVDHRQYSAVNFVSPAYNYNVDPAKTYLLKLRNTTADQVRPDLTAQITFP